MNTLPIFASGRARLLDNQTAVSQFAALERRTFSTGRERVNPGPGQRAINIRFPAARVRVGGGKPANAWSFGEKTPAEVVENWASPIAER
jgi:hypothetical protein